MPDDNNAELEIGSDEWLAQEEAALEVAYSDESEIDVSSQSDGGGESDVQSEVGEVGEPTHTPGKEADATADAGDSSDGGQTTNEGDESGKESALLHTDVRVPVAALSTARREARKVNRENAQLKDELAQKNAKLKAYEFEGNAEGIELKGQTELQPMTTEAFQAIVDRDGIDEANNQRILREQAIERQQQTAPTDNDGQANTYTNDEYDAAIESNPTVLGWLMLAREGQKEGHAGKQAPWEAFAKKDEELPLVPNESADERFVRVVKATEAALITQAGGDPAASEKEKPTPKDLSDVPGKGRMASKTDALGALDDLKQVEAMLSDEELADEVMENAGW